MKKDMTAEEYLHRVLSDDVRDDCPMRRTLELLSGKWRTHIIYELCKKPSCRFGELKKALPRITNTMLTKTLLAPGGNRHFEPGENNQFQPGRNRQSVPGGCSQPRFECRF